MWHFRGVYRYCESQFRDSSVGYSIDSGPAQVVDLAGGEQIPPHTNALTDGAVTNGHSTPTLSGCASPTG